MIAYEINKDLLGKKFYIKYNGALTAVKIVEVNFVGEYIDKEYHEKEDCRESRNVPLFTFITPRDEMVSETKIETKFALFETIKDAKNDIQVTFTLPDLAEVARSIGAGEGVKVHESNGTWRGEQSFYYDLLIRAQWDVCRVIKNTSFSVFFHSLTAQEGFTLGVSCGKNCYRGAQYFLATININGVFRKADCEKYYFDKDKVKEWESTYPNATICRQQNEIKVIDF